MSMKWAFPKRKAHTHGVGCTSGVDRNTFNTALPENDGGSICLIESSTAKNQSGENEADDDIRAGRVKKFDNPDDLIESLNQPW